MARSMINLTGVRTPFTDVSARNWLRSGRRQISRELDAWLADFLAAGNRAYGFMQHDQFVRDLTRWVEVHTFAVVFSGDPLGMLRNHFLHPWNPPSAHPDTTQPATYLTIVEQMVHIGPRVHCNMFDNPIDVRDRADPELLPQANFTSMRSNDDDNRLDAPVITPYGQWWFTPIQTGCTVVICDWGNGWTR